MLTVLGYQGVCKPPDGLVTDLVGNVRFRPPFVVLRPALGQIQLGIHQRASARRGVGEEDTNLAVVDLSKSPAPLARDADGIVTLLWKSRPVEHENGTAVAELFCDVGPNLLSDTRVLPSAFPYKTLKSAPRHIVRVRDRLDRLSLKTAHETLEIHLQVPFLLSPCADFFLQRH